jgi:hypothetical protein
MAYYIDSENNYPKHQGDILAIEPDWEPGHPLPEGWQQVEPGVMPDFTDNQYVEELAPVLVKGKLTRQFQVHDYTSEELAAREAIRNEMTI